MKKSEVPTGLRAFLDRLVTYAVPHFGAGSDSEESMALVEDRTPKPVDESHVASSASSTTKRARNGAWEQADRHHVLLDIDIPAWLIPSSSHGKSHLYVELPHGGAFWEDYETFLLAAAKIGLIEDGYAKASIRRGHTALRLPWVKKGEENLNDPPTEPNITAEQYEAQEAKKAAPKPLDKPVRAPASLGPFDWE